VDKREYGFEERRIESAWNLCYNMDTVSLQEEPGTSWSETTTPAEEETEEIEDVVRLQPPVRQGIGFGSKPRYLRGPIRRRVVKPKTHSETAVTFGQQSSTFPMLDLRRSMEGSDTSASSAITIITSAASSCTDPWSSSSGFVEEEEDSDNWRDSMEQDEFRSDMIVPKLEPEDEDVNMAEIKDIPAVDTVSIVPTKRPRGRPRKHPKTTAEEKSKITKNRSKTGCITCRRRKKKCDEKKPGC
jgi:hypothetical protein